MRMRRSGSRPRSRRGTRPPRSPPRAPANPDDFHEGAGEMLRRLQEERGASMILALIVTMIVVCLGIVIVNQSIHATNSSGLDRRRMIAVSASEAGVDDYYHYLNDL